MSELQEKLYFGVYERKIIVILTVIFDFNNTWISCATLLHNKPVISSKYF